VNLQVNRKPKHLPRLNIKERGKSIFNIKFDDIELLDYNPDSSIKADIAV
jgi:thymidylate synthase